MIDGEQVRTYLTALFSDIPQGSWFLIWTLQRHQSFWFQSIDDAVAELTGNPLYDERDVYAGMCTSATNNGKTKRCDAASVTSAAGIWADIDIYSADTKVHKKGNLPNSVAEVQAWLAAYARPSMTVNTGHGLHCYWLFDRRFVCQADPERLRLASLAERWQKWLAVGALQRGWTMDMTGDLARVLRVPGTSNYKNREVIVPAVITEQLPARYSVNDLEAMIPGSVATENAVPAAPAPPSIGHFILNPDRVPPQEVVDQLAGKFPAGFRDSFARVKPLAGGDTSDSAYDFSLAVYGARAELDDQTIADIIIASRRQANHDLKLRQDYYTHTIEGARRQVRKDDSIEELTTLAHATPESCAALGISEEDLHKQLIDRLSGVLGVQVQRILHFQQTPDDTYWIQLDGADRTIPLGTIQNVLDQRKFQGKVLDAIGETIPPFKTQEWLKIASLLVKSAEVRNDTAARGDEAVKSWLSMYLMDHRIYDDMNLAAATGEPFYAGETEDDPSLDPDDRIGRPMQAFIFLEPFIRWVYLHCAKKETPQTMSQFLTVAGCVHSVRHFTVGKKRVSRNVWQVPLDVVPRE